MAERPLRGEAPEFGCPPNAPTRSSPTRRRSTARASEPATASPADRRKILTIFLIHAYIPAPAARHETGARPETDRWGWRAAGRCPRRWLRSLPPRATARHDRWLGTGRRAGGGNAPADRPVAGTAGISCGAAHDEAACDEGSLESVRGLVNPPNLAPARDPSETPRRDRTAPAATPEPGTPGNRQHPTRNTGFRGVPRHCSACSLGHAPGAGPRAGVKPRGDARATAALDQRGGVR